MKKNGLRNFTKFIGKQQCLRLFFNKAPGLRPATLLKKRLWHRPFPVNFAKLPRTSFYKTHLVAASVCNLYWKTIYQNNVNDIERKETRADNN